MICPLCDTDCPDGTDSDFIRVKGRCFACDLELWIERKIEKIKGEDNDRRNSVDDQADV